MEINNASGVNQYLNIQSANPQGGQIEEQAETLEAASGQESTGGVQQAFQVNLTQEAQDLLTSEQAQEEPQPETAETVPADESPTATGNQTGPGEIVNLTA